MDYIFNVKAKFDKASQTQVMNDFLKVKKDIEKDTIKINAILNPDTLSIKAIQDQLNKEKLNINIGNVTFDPTEVDSSINKATNQIEQKLNASMSQMTMNVSGFTGGTKVQYIDLLKQMGLDKDNIEEATREIDKLGISINKISATNDTTDNKITALIQGEDALGRTVTLTQTITSEADEAARSVVNITTNYKQQQIEVAKANKELQQQLSYMAKIQRQAESIKAANSERKNPLKDISIADDGSGKLTYDKNEVTKTSKAYADAYNALLIKIAEYNAKLAEGERITAQEKRDLDDMVSNVRILGSNAKSTQSTATSNRSKDVGQQIKAEEESLKKFVLEIEKSDVATQQFAGDIKKLQKMLEEAGSSKNKVKAFGDYKDELDIVKASFQKAKEEATQFANVAKQLESLQTFSQSGILGKSTGDSGVQALNTKISEIRDNWEKLQAEMASNESSEATDEQRAKMHQLAQTIAETTQEAKDLKTSLTQTADATNLAVEKQNFGNRIDNWLKENTKASESLRQKMIELKNEMQNADRIKFTELKKEFAALNNYAKATGQTGKSMFDTIKEKIGKFTGWFTIANAIMTITNYAKQSIGVLHEMDDILTEISKTSDMSEESLKRLGETAFESASKYGVTVQSYLTGVQEMSRAGYDEAAESMANLAILAQAAGDMTAQTAQDYLIATDAAYQLAGSEEKLSKILDGQNMINLYIIVPLYGNIQGAVCSYRETGGDT